MSHFDKITAQTSVKDLELGQLTLQRRYKRLYWLAIISAIVVVLTIVVSAVQQQLVLGFWDLSRTVQQFHIPASVDLSRFQTSELPNYLQRLLSWLGWFVLKVFTMLMGSFITIRVLKHFGYFQRRFRSLVLKFVAWLISCIVIWSSLSFLQQRMYETEYQPYRVLLSYENNIQNSVIARQLAQGREQEAVKAYLLAQTALLHEPADLAAAKSYVQHLIVSEETQPYFASYGFKDEQLWAMQQQVFAQSISPIAQQVDVKAQRAQQVSTLLQWLLYVLMGIFSTITLLSYVVGYHIQQRCQRIAQMLSQY